jgi:hypothetical protein
MKNIIKPLIALFAIFTITSCSTDDVEDRPVITAKDAPVLSAPGMGSSYTLILENAAAQAERFVWTSASFDQNVAINYEVQLDAVGNEFADPHSLGSVIGENQLSVSVETLNAAVIAEGGQAFTEGSFEVRVKASVNDTFEPLYSNVATILITPYVALDPELFLVGAPQGYYGLNQWDNTTAMPMRYIGNGTTKVFEGYLKVNAGEGFKFIGEQGTWDNGNFGTVGGVQNGTLENSGSSGDIKIAETNGPGLYYVWVDIDNLQYKAVKMNWGIIGSATAGGWDNETPMTFDFANNKYTLSTTLSAGEMKFRAKNAANINGGTDDWKFNVGVSNPTVVYNPGATNIAVTAGTHNIELHINFDGTATYSGL